MGFFFVEGGGEKRFTRCHQTPGERRKGGNARRIPPLSGGGEEGKGKGECPPLPSTRAGKRGEEGEQTSHSAGGEKGKGVVLLPCAR